MNGQHEKNRWVDVGEALDVGHANKQTNNPKRPSSVN